MLEEIRKQLCPYPQVSLVAVSKFHPASAIQQAYDEGQRIFGESRVQELSAKYQELPKDIEWHFIGHLQRNKIKQLLPFVHLIHSVDSESLLVDINRHAREMNLRKDVLLQLHVAQEETKYGMSIEECRGYLQSYRWRELSNVRLRGLMCMASNTDDETRVRSDFRQASEFFDEAANLVNSPEWNIKSWGMSGDFHLAIAEGATHVRIGSMIFGERS